MVRVEGIGTDKYGVERKVFVSLDGDGFRIEEVEPTYDEVLAREDFVKGVER